MGEDDGVDPFSTDVLLDLRGHSILLTQAASPVATLYPNTTYPSAQLLSSLLKVPHFESAVPNTS